MNLIFILGDQLNSAISSLRGANPATDTVLMCEVHEETAYVKHHKKKIALILSAMRHFAAQLRARRFHVTYVTLDDEQNTGSFSSELQRCFEHYSPNRVIVTEPSEYRVLTSLQALQSRLNLEIREDDRFLASQKEFENWAKNRKQLRMEFFYREMRKKYKVLMSGKEPEGGQWNFDVSNRKPPNHSVDIPSPFEAKPDSMTNEVLTLVNTRFNHHFGELYPFTFAVTRTQALDALDQFMQQRLVQFGDYQDAMVVGKPFMFHSHISMYLNCGLLLPLECIRAAEQAFRAQKAPLNAVEGFIRQILGWREFVRGLYWYMMPDYAQLNFFSHTRPLPVFFWQANTELNCLKHSIEETQRNAYAHHIQRLMVIGNFSLLTELDPKQVNEWFLIVYADAFEWVELPNVTGMALFADSGILASKPYISSGAYINKMSNYCQNCRFKVKEKTGPNACPFNYLYWYFLDKHKDKLASNPRLGLAYQNLDKLPEEKLEQIRQSSHTFLDTLTQPEPVSPDEQPCISVSPDHTAQASFNFNSDSDFDNDESKPT